MSIDDAARDVFEPFAGFVATHPWLVAAWDEAHERFRKHFPAEPVTREQPTAELELDHGNSGLRLQEKERADKIEAVTRNKIEDAQSQLVAVTTERDRLWRIAVCPNERLDEMKAEIESLGTATPEACRAIDAWNHRLDKRKANDDLAAMRRQVRTAQDAAVNAIIERREFEDERDAVMALGKTTIEQTRATVAASSLADWVRTRFVHVEDVNEPNCRPRRLYIGDYLPPNHLILAIDDRDSGTIHADVTEEWTTGPSDARRQMTLAEIIHDEDGGPDWSVWDYGPMPLCFPPERPAACGGEL